MSERIQTIIAFAVLIVGWVVYGSIFLVQDPNGDKYVFNQNSQNAILAVMVIASLAVAVASVYWMNKWYNRQARVDNISQLSFDITRWFLDENFEEYARGLGVAMNRDAFKIKPEVLAYCDLECLARLLSFLFYRHFDSINSSVASTPNVFFELADALLGAWPKERISKFVNLIDEESIILSGHLKYALERQTINREVADFNQSIEERLAAIEQRYVAQTMVSAQNIGRQLNVCSYLTGGGSAVKQWFSRFLKSQSVVSKSMA